MLRTPVYIVCSPRPAVGKTLVARLLTEFLALARGQAIAFDINLGEPSLVDFLPDLTETADISDTYGKMALMDRLIVHDGLAKVVDLGFHAFDEFFQMCDEIGFTKEGDRRGIEPVLVYLADHSRMAAQSHKMLRTTFPTTALIAIDNEHVLRGDIPPGFTPARMLHLPALPAFLKTYIDRVPFSFTGYLRDTSDTSAELYQWTRDNFSKLRDAGDNLRRYRV